MPDSPKPRPGATRLLLVAATVLLAACGAAAPSPSPIGSARASIAARASVSPTASIAASVEPIGRPSPDESPSATASSVVTAPPSTPSATPPTGTTAPTRKPTPTVKPTPIPTVKPEPKPTVKATPKPTPTPSPRPTVAPIVLSIEVRDFLFAPSSVTGPAGLPFGIRFSNKDQAIPHNVTITTDAGSLRFNGTIINGVSSVTYEVPSLAAGAYGLGCIVHPAMTGTLTIR